MTVYALRSLDADRRGSHGQWPEPGIWTPDVPPVMCESGWHACPDTAGLLDWLDETVWLVELGGVIVGPEGGKRAAERARLVRRLPYDPRGWAADCAEHVLPIYEAAYPGDARPREAIAAARSGAAAGAAARAAARAAAWAAARAAADAAADAAAAAAAGASARDAAWNAERAWQAQHLAEMLCVPADLTGWTP